MAAWRSAIPVSSVGKDPEEEAGEGAKEVVEHRFQRIVDPSCLDGLIWLATSRSRNFRGLGPS